MGFFKKLFILTIILLSIKNTQVLGHSGGTDSSGGHVCRTNCGDYNLQYGEYHTHTPSTEDNSSSLPNTTTPSLPGVTTPQVTQKSMDEYRKEYEEKMYTQGYKEGYQIAFDVAASCRDIGYSAPFYPQESYVNGYQKGKEDAIRDGEKTCKELTQRNYQNGFEAGKNDFERGSIYFANTIGIPIEQAYRQGYDDGWKQAEQDELKGQMQEASQETEYISTSNDQKSALSEVEEESIDESDTAFEKEEETDEETEEDYNNKVLGTIICIILVGSLLLGIAKRW